MQPGVATFVAKVIGFSEKSALLEIEDFLFGEGSEFDEGAAKINEVFHGCIYWGVKVLGTGHQHHMTCGTSSNLATVLHNLRFDEAAAENGSLFVFEWGCGLAALRLGF